MPFHSWLETTRESLPFAEYNSIMRMRGCRWLSRIGDVLLGGRVENSDLSH